MHTSTTPARTHRKKYPLPGHFALLWRETQTLCAEAVMSVVSWPVAVLSVAEWSVVESIYRGTRHRAINDEPTLCAYAMLVRQATPGHAPAVYLGRVNTSLE